MKKATTLQQHGNKVGDGPPVGTNGNSALYEPVLDKKRTMSPQRPLGGTTIDG